MIQENGRECKQEANNIIDITANKNKATCSRHTTSITKAKVNPMERNQGGKHNDPMNPQFDDDMTSRTITSVNEVTGMIARPPLNEAEVEGYLTLFPVMQQESESAKRSADPAQQKQRSHQEN